MALKFPGFKFFSGDNPKSRVIVLLISFIGVAVLIYISMQLLGSGATTTGPSKVAGAPSGLQSVPGSKQLSPQYYRTLVQANTQAAQQAQITGGSAVPTLINTATSQPTQSCTILCSNENKASISDDINNLVKSDKLLQKYADQLLALAKKNVSVGEYGAALDELVRQGRLTPEQARLLLEKYKKQHAQVLLTASANSMDGLIKSGQLLLGIANDLLELQKRQITPAEYAAYLAKLVKEGKISPDTTAQLLAQYTQQYAMEASKEGAFAISEMAKAGQMTPEVAKILGDMQSKNVPMDQYEAMLNRLLTEGKITPDVALRLLAQYRAQRTGIGAAGLLGEMVKKGGEAGEEAKRLLTMQANNASLTDYTEELKRTVAAGLLTPEEAASLLQQYQAMLATFVAGTAPSAQLVIPGAEDFAKLQQTLKQKAAVAPTPVATGQFEKAVAQQQVQATEDRQQKVQQLQAAMSAQAQTLLTAWKTPLMKHEGASVSKSAPDTSSILTSTTSIVSSVQSAGSKPGEVKPALIKAGTVAYAILDTTVDSDYPDTPVMVTIVQGPLKGAKLIGKLNLAKDKDKVSLNFTQMDQEGWPASKTVSAFAVDPDTARTVLASHVDYHYLKRYGAIMATSFLSGYSSAITQAGQSTTGIFGTSATHPALSPGNKLAVGLGQIGTNLTTMIQPNINMPATVKVNSGVGLGILFVSDVTQ